MVVERLVMSLASQLTGRFDRNKLLENNGGCSVFI